MYSFWTKSLLKKCDFTALSKNVLNFIGFISLALFKSLKLLRSPESLERNGPLWLRRTNECGSTNHMCMIVSNMNNKFPGNPNQRHKCRSFHLLNTVIKNHIQRIFLIQNLFKTGKQFFFCIDTYRFLK